MRVLTTRNAALLAVMLLFVAAAPTQTQGPRDILSVEGYPGQAAVIHVGRRTFVDVEDLARITNGTLHREQGQIVLELCCDTQRPSHEIDRRHKFSRPFMRAAIEAMGSMREWAGMLMITVQNGYPVGNTMAGNTIAAYQGRAADQVALAAAAASTDSDYRGLEMLRSEFGQVKDWSEQFVQARISMSATNMIVTENAFNNDEEAQRIIGCGQFLANMFASGSVEEDAACR